MNILLTRTVKQCTKDFKVWKSLQMKTCDIEQISDTIYAIKTDYLIDEMTISSSAIISRDQLEIDHDILFQPNVQEALFYSVNYLLFHKTLTVRCAAYFTDDILHIVFGHSGAGKSTFVSRMAEQRSDLKLVCDDSLLIEIDDQGLQVRAPLWDVLYQPNELLVCGHWRAYGLSGYIAQEISNPMEVLKTCLQHSVLYGFETNTSSLIFDLCCDLVNRSSFSSAQ